jgi:hypothetical protein
MLPRLRYHSLPDCLFLYDQALEWEVGPPDMLAPAAREMAARDYASGWLPRWFPLSQQEGPLYLAVDLLASDGDTAPVLEVDSGGGETKRVAGALGEYVTRVVDEIDAGQWLGDRENHTWDPTEGWTAWAAAH